jgi:hypothetical protein
MSMMAVESVAIYHHLDAEHFVRIDIYQKVLKSRHRAEKCWTSRRPSSYSYRFYVSQAPALALSQYLSRAVVLARDIMCKKKAETHSIKNSLVVTHLNAKDRCLNGIERMFPLSPLSQRSWRYAWVKSFADLKADTSFFTR